MHPRQECLFRVAGRTCICFQDVLAAPGADERANEVLECEAKEQRVGLVSGGQMCDLKESRSMKTRWKGKGEEENGYCVSVRRLCLCSGVDLNVALMAVRIKSTWRYVQNEAGLIRSWNRKEGKG